MRQYNGGRDFHELIFTYELFYLGGEVIAALFKPFALIETDKAFYLQSAAQSLRGGVGILRDGERIVFDIDLVDRQ